MLGYPCCPAVPAVNAPFQALSVQYLLKAEQTCIASVAPRLAWRMHWRLDEYGAESSRWRRLQQGCRFPRKSCCFKPPSRSRQFTPWLGRPRSQSRSLTVPGSCRSSAQTLWSLFMTNLLLCLTAQRQIRISAALITHRRRRRHVSLLPMALAARFLATADLRASDFTSELWYSLPSTCGTGTDFLR